MSTSDGAKLDRHGATIMIAAGRHGCWWHCTCGDGGDTIWRTALGASLSWARHVATS